MVSNNHFEVRQGLPLLMVPEVSLLLFECGTSLYTWLSLLYILAKEANGPRYIQLGWGANCEFPWQLRRGAEERGLGDSLHFVRALGKIQGLEKLAIEGYYAKHWPAYLEETMGCAGVS